MQKAIFISNFRSSISLQNRVDSIRDYIFEGSHNGASPYQVFILGDESVDPLSTKQPPLGCVITYTSPEDPNRAYDDDMNFEAILADMTDPMFANDCKIVVFDKEHKDASLEAFTSNFKMDMDPLDYETFKVGFEMSTISQESGNNNYYGLSAADIAGLEVDEFGEIVQKNTSSESDITSVTDVPAAPNSEDEDLSTVVDEKEQSEPTKPYTIKANELPDEPTPKKDESGSYVQDFYDELKRLMKDRMPTAQELAGVIAWMIMSHQKEPVIEDVTSEEDYSYQNAIPYVERPVSADTQFISSTESVSYKLEIDPETAKPFRFNVIDDILTGMGEFLSFKPKAAQIFTVKETEAFMRKIMKEGKEIHNHLNKKVFTGVNAGYRKKFQPATDICANYQRPPLAVMNAVRGIVIPILKCNLTFSETRDFFANDNLVSDFYWTVMHNIRHILIESKLAKYASLQILSFVQKPDTRYVGIVIDTGIQIVTPDEKESLIAAGKAASISVESAQPNIEVEEPTITEDQSMTDDEAFAAILGIKDDTSSPSDESSVTSDKTDDEDTTANVLDLLGVNVNKSEISTESSNDTNIPKLTGYELVEELSKTVKNDDELFNKMCEFKDYIGLNILNEAISINMMVKIKDGYESKNNPSVQSARSIKLLNI